MKGRVHEETTRRDIIVKQIGLKENSNYMGKKQRARYTIILNRGLLYLVEFGYLSYKYRMALNEKNPYCSQIGMNYCRTFPFSNMNSNSDLDHKYKKKGY